jgi:amidase
MPRDADAAVPAKTNPAFQSASQLARMVRTKKIGALELLELYAKRVAKYDRKINAVVVKDLARARKAARAADAALARPKTAGPFGPLFGVPMTVKESFNVAGLPTTWGLPELKDERIKSDAVAVQKLRDAGAVIFGKTNIPVVLADWQTFNPVYGGTSNPWNLGHTPGGSSGGAAAAVAAGLTGLEFGSDIAGSIRTPAHYCGVYGHKPTWGILSTEGHTLRGAVAKADMMAIGPLARSADDLALALSLTAGPDDIDGVGWKLALPKPAKRSLGEFRIAVLTTDPTAEVDESVQAQILALAKFLSKQGAKVSTRARPAFDHDEAHRTFIQLLRSATSGHQTQKRFEQLRKIAQDLPAKDNSYYAQMARGNTLSHKDWLAWNEKRHKMRLAWAEFFHDWDLLLCPAAPSPAFSRNEQGERWERMIMINGKPQPSTTGMFWAGYPGMVGLPATVAPVGLTRDGLPVGVQIIGPQFADLSCIGFAQLLEREYHAFVAPPGYE